MLAVVIFLDSRRKLIMDRIIARGRIKTLVGMRSLMPDAVRSAFDSRLVLLLGDYYDNSDKYKVIGPGTCTFQGCYVFRREIELVKKPVFIVRQR